MDVTAAISIKEVAIEACDEAVEVAVKMAVREAKSEERRHHSESMKKEKEKSSSIQDALDKQNVLITRLLNLSIVAEWATTKAERQATQSSRRSADVQQMAKSYEDKLEQLRRENNTYRTSIIELETMVDQSS